MMRGIAGLRHARSNARHEKKARADRGGTAREEPEAEEVMRNKPPIPLQYKSPGQPRRRHAIYWCVAATLAAVAISIALHRRQEPKGYWYITYTDHPTQKITQEFTPDNK
jgi:hypothetical protein